MGVKWWLWVLSCLYETDTSIGKGKFPVYCMQAYRRSRSIAPHLILDRGEWSNSRPRERTPVGEGLVAGLDVLEKESLEPVGIWTPDRSVRPVTNMSAQIVNLMSIFVCVLYVLTATSTKPQSAGLLDNILFCLYLFWLSLIRKVRDR